MRRGLSSRAEGSVRLGASGVAFEAWDYAYDGRPAALSILFAEGLGVGFAVGVEEVFAAFLPGFLHFRRGDVPVGAAFFGDGAEVLS